MRALLFSMQLAVNKRMWVVVCVCQPVIHSLAGIVIRVVPTTSM
jgi:hypothetical protein